MNISSSRNQVTVCKGDTCLTVVGELAKVIAFVVVVGMAAWTINEIAKVLK
jgi:hypothetical protein